MSNLLIMCLTEKNVVMCVFYCESKNIWCIPRTSSISPSIRTHGHFLAGSTRISSSGRESYTPKYYCNIFIDECVVLSMWHPVVVHKLYRSVIRSAVMHVSLTLIGYSAIVWLEIPHTRVGYYAISTPGVKKQGWMTDQSFSYLTTFSWRDFL